MTKSEQMARVRSKDTALELVVRRALWARGHRYRIRPRLRGTPDIAFPGAKVAVFIDGCFWHGCIDHYTAPTANAAFWQDKLARNQKRDLDVDEALAAIGWRALRIWEHELTDIEAVIRRVEKALESTGQST